MVTSPPTTIDIVMPFPPAALNPNHRSRWERIKAVTGYRRDCRTVAIDARNRSGVAYPLKPPVTALVTFILTTHQRRDADNLQAMMKPAWDSLVDALLLKDDNVWDLKTSYEVTLGKTREVRVRLEGAA